MTVMYYGGGEELLFHTTHPFLSITCSHAIFQIVTHKITFEKLFSDKCSILCTTTSRYKFLVNNMNSAQNNHVRYLTQCETGSYHSRDAENLSLLECYTRPTGK